MSNSSNDKWSDVTVVILAGGLGVRLRKVVSDRPKVMALVNGRPFLTYLLDQLEHTGLNNVVLCTGYEAGLVSNELGNTYKGIEIIYSQEDKPLGTCGALKHAISNIDSKYILVMNGDSYVDVDLKKFLNWHLAAHRHASIMLVRVNNVSRYGKVTISDDKLITSFEEKGNKSGHGWINAGIYLLGREALKCLPQKTPSSLEEHFFTSLIGKGLYGFQSKGSFLDIGTPESYAQANSFFSNQLSTID